MTEDEFRTGKGVAHDEQPEQKMPSPGKETNPKAAFGDDRVPLSTVPATVMAELGVALLEGAFKYGRHNYRVAGCRASTYYDAMQRHLMKWWEGEDIDPDSGMHHLVKAMASATVLRDAMIQGLVTDDRPPASPPAFFDDLNSKVVDLRKMFPNPKEPYINAPTPVGDLWISLSAPIRLKTWEGKLVIQHVAGTTTYWEWDEMHAQYYRTQKRPA